MKLKKTVQSSLPVLMYYLGLLYLACPLKFLVLYNRSFSPDICNRLTDFTHLGDQRMHNIFCFFFTLAFAIQYPIE